MKNPALALPTIAVAAALAALAWLPQGCSRGNGLAACAVTYSGNFADSAFEPVGCATLVADTAGFAAPGAANVLAIDSTKPDGVEMALRIVLPIPPSRGVFTPESVTRWSAVGYRAGGGCRFAAGSHSTPEGGFTLRIDSIEGEGAGARAHGRLHVDQYVQARVLAAFGADCGPGDTEQVDVVF